ncbi:hypothetical protein B0O99DRAFT_699440, partial [Bisporella sp. PMI_857]
GFNISRHHIASPFLLCSSLFVIPLFVGSLCLLCHVYYLTTLPNCYVVLAFCIYYADYPSMALGIRTLSSLLAEAGEALAISYVYKTNDIYSCSRLLGVMGKQC